MAEPVPSTDEVARRTARAKREAERAAERERKKAGANGHDTEPPAALTLDEKRTAIRALAKLDPLNFAEELKPQAARLGYTVRQLEKLVQHERGGAGDSQGQGRPLDLPSPERWPKPVNGDALLHEMTEFYTRHATVPEGAEVVLALWSLHCHAFTTWRITPRLHIKSAIKGSGKSTVLELLGYMVPKPLETESASPAALFRATELSQPTLLMDEADLWIGQDLEVRAFINAGHKAGSQSLRCVGDTQEVRQFNCHAPAALASIGNLPGPIEDRSIRLTMRRRLRTDTNEEITDVTRETAKRLVRQAARWIADHHKQLKAAKPDMGTLINRAADRWRPLYAIADVIGGKWLKAVRDATVTLSFDDQDADGQAEQLIRDCAAAWGDWTKANPDARAHEMTSVALVERLVAMEGRPWAEVGRTRKPLTTNGLAQRLKPFGIAPDYIGPEGDRKRGYRLFQFEDAFERVSA